MGTLSKGTGAVAGISQRQGRYKRSAPAFLIILAALVLLLGNDSLRLHRHCRR